MSEFLRLLKMSLTYKWWMLLAAFTGFLTIGSGVGLMMTAAYIISRAALQPSIAEIQVAIVGVRFFGIARGMLRYLERLISHDTTFRLLKRFRVRIYETIEPLAPARLIYHKSADLLNRLIADVQNLENFYVRIIAPPLIAVLTSILMWFLIGGFSWNLVFIMLFFQMIAGIAVPLLAFHINRRLGQQAVRSKAELNIRIIDHIQGLGELLMFNRDQTYLGQIARQSSDYNNIQKKMGALNALTESLIGLCMHLTVISVLYAAAPMVHDAVFEGIYLAVIIMGIMASFEAYLPLPEGMQLLSANVESGKRIFAIMDSKPAVPDFVSDPEIPDHYSISVKNVQFSYEMNADSVLRNISFKVPQGQQAAIVGASGAGKSTVINLLLRFWDYRDGQILIGDTDIRHIDPQDLRSMIAVVSQRTHIFNSTIRENLLIANPDAPEALLWQVLERAKLDIFVKNLPAGLDTPTGEQGFKLSGGERQRLSIARALIKNAPILLLDEATANLDIITEKAFMETLNEVCGDKTTLIITHRLSGIKNAGNIYVMDQGAIIEQGRHEQLLKSKGHYFRMWDLQSQIRQIENLPV